MHGYRYAAITAAPLLWLVTVTFSAGLSKIFSSDPHLGFLSHAAALTSLLQSGQISAVKIAETHAIIFNERLDASLTALFLLLVTVILVESLRTWASLLRGTRSAVTAEAPFVLSCITAETV